MESFLKQTPFLRPLISFTTGILLEKQIHAGMSLWITLVLVSTLCWGLLLILPISIKIRGGHWTGIALMVSIISFGGMHVSMHALPEPFSNRLPQQFVLLHLQYEKKTYPNQVRYPAKLYVQEKHRWICKGVILCFMDNRKAVHPGDLLLAKGDIEPMPGISYPGGFDMKKWGTTNGIVGQIRLSERSDLMRLRHRDSNIRKTLDQIRHQTIGMLRNRITDPLNAGLAEAMLIGYKDDLDRHLLEAYTNTGVVHIIAISGLHLGLIFMLLNGLLRWLTGKDGAIRMGPYVTLPILWIFSMLTGSSASVVRSAVMFSFLLFGGQMKRKNRSMNALLGSAFIMIACDVQVLSDLGFQLSYAAVASILIFQNAIRESITCIHPLTKAIWAMISLTLSAQLLTTPLVIYHFHRFPLLFLFANLIAVPLSSLILLLEITILFSYPFDRASALLGKLTESLIGWMNTFVFRLDHVHWGTVKGIALSGTLILFLCLFVITLVKFANKPTKPIFLSSILLLIMISAIALMEGYQVHRNRRIIIMDNPGSTCILHQHGRTGIMLLGGRLLAQPQKISLMLEQTGVALGIREWKLYQMPDTPLLIRMPVLENQSKHPELVRQLSILHALPLRDITPLLLRNSGKDQVFIADASNSLWKSHEWEKQAQGLHLRFLSNAHQGYVERRCACPNIK